MKYDYATDVSGIRHIIVEFEGRKMLFTDSEDLLQFILDKFGFTSNDGDSELIKAINYINKTYRVKS